MYRRESSETVERRLLEPRRFVQIVSGPRQTGKTTAVKQALQFACVSSRYATADGLMVPPASWLESEWSQARDLARMNGRAILVLDEVQKIKGWADLVKRLWDEDSWNDVPLLVVLTGSSSLLLQKGYSESLAGRYEVIRSSHWSLAEMETAFGYSMEDYLLFGGYPGGAALKDDEERWLEYMRDSIIEATLSRDVLQMEEIRKPALLRNLFILGAQYSAQELSYRKMLGQLDDRGNTATLAHYLELLSQAGLLTGLQKYGAKDINARASSPRLLAYDPALMSATWSEARERLLGIPDNRGHLVESAVGARLLARKDRERFEVCWWRAGDKEVDFVLKKGDALVALEVKSGRVKSTDGMAEFRKLYPYARPMVVGDANTPVETFLRDEVPLFE